MLIRLAAIFACLIIANVSSASISDVSVIDGTFTISGVSFGTNVLDTVSLEQTIESGAVGEEVSFPPGWGADVTTTARKHPEYSDTYSHNGTKSIKSSTPLSTQYTSGFWYSRLETFQKAYISWWVRARAFQFREGDTSGQWKVFRITPDLFGGIYADQPHNWYWSQQFKNGSLNLEDCSNMFLNFCSSNENPTYDTSCYSGNPTGGSGGIYRANGLFTDVWQRVEVWVDQSGVSVQNGSIYTTIQKEGYAPVIFTDFLNDTCTRQSDQYPWRAVVWENYIGNGVDAGDIYIDDIYIQFGTRKRVEIGNNAVFANCTHREIQPAVTWSDTGITGTFNRGSFETGDTVYFFVVDEDGAASNGYAVTIGGEPTIANPVVEILTESGQTTTASIFEITGTATADTGQTISGVTCDGQTVTPDDGIWDEQSEAFTCLASLALGENTLVFVGSDGTRTGQDSITVARTRGVTSTSVSHGVLRH